MACWVKANMTWIKKNIASFYYLRKKFKQNTWQELREKYPNKEFFWSAFFRARAECGDLLRKSQYSAQVRENTDQNTSNLDTFDAVKGLKN